MVQREVDWVLTMLLDGLDDVALDEDQNTELAVTPFTGGLVIAGLAISQREYFDRLGAQFPDGSTGGVWRGQMSALADRANEGTQLRRDRGVRLEERFQAAHTSGEQERLRGELQGLERSYVTLKDVEVFGLGPSPVPLPLWRGRLSEIAGWSLGRLSGELR